MEDRLGEENGAAGRRWPEPSGTTCRNPAKLRAALMRLRQHMPSSRQCYADWTPEEARTGLFVGFSDDRGLDVVVCLRLRLRLRLRRRLRLRLGLAVASRFP
jgi:hypothetical protein